MTLSRIVPAAVVVLLALHGASVRAQAPELPPDGATSSLPPDATNPTAPAAGATTTPAAAGDPVLEAQRTPVEVVSEHFLGSTSRAVRFDWRRKTVAVGVLGSEVLERNVFGTFRIGGLARKAFGDVMAEVGVTYFHPESTQASDQLSLTPYRQAGRPWHIELDINAAYPLAEGVVTPLTDFVPPAELAFFAMGGVRYLFYPLSFADQKPLDALQDLALPALTREELTGINPSRTEGMLVDPARYHALIGLMLDASFQPGVVFSPRALIAVPLLTPVTGSQLGLWWELSMFLGYAF